MIFDTMMHGNACLCIERYVEVSAVMLKVKAY